MMLVRPLPNSDIMLPRLNSFFRKRTRIASLRNIHHCAASRTIGIIAEIHTVGFHAVRIDAVTAFPTCRTCEPRAFRSRTLDPVRPVFIISPMIYAHFLRLLSDIKSQLLRLVLLFPLEAVTRFKCRMRRLSADVSAREEEITNASRPCSEVCTAPLLSKLIRHAVGVIFTVIRQPFIYAVIVASASVTKKFCK